MRHKKGSFLRYKEWVVATQRQNGQDRAFEDQFQIRHSWPTKGKAHSSPGGPTESVAERPHACELREYEKNQPTQKSRHPDDYSISAKPYYAIAEREIRNAHA